MHPLDPSLTDYQPDSGWSRLAARPVHVHWLDTDHDAILHAPVVNQLAASLRTLMDQHYAAQNRPARRQRSSPPRVEPGKTRFNHGGTRISETPL
jgi:hypothetical protein